MRDVVKTVALEVTRRCNLSCSHCMRGDSINKDLDKKYIDIFFDNNSLVIYKLIFSGGEPLLKADLIIYTIDKIIKNKLPVLSIEISSNGTIYDARLLNKLEEYYLYAYKYYELSNELGIKTLVRLRFSNDQYHSYDKAIMKKYEDTKRNISIDYTGYIDYLDDGVLLTGRAKNFMFGKQFTYDIYDIKREETNFGNCYFDNNFYITANGDITTNGNGTYKDMDNNNLGNICEVNINTLHSDKQKNI